MSLSRRLIPLIAAAAVAAPAAVATASSPGSPVGAVRAGTAAEPPPSTWLVTLRPGARPGLPAATRLLSRISVALVQATPAQAAALRSLDGVTAVEPDSSVHVTVEPGTTAGSSTTTDARKKRAPKKPRRHRKGTHPKPPGHRKPRPPRHDRPRAVDWNLDRLDQDALPLDGKYAPQGTGTGVTAYVVDSGIRFDHADFAGRAVPGFDADGKDGADCNGHGTHVAGTIGGTRHGVATQVRLVSVRVMECDGGGTTSAVLQGLDWVAGDHKAGDPAVANVSLGGPPSEALDTAVARLVHAGVDVVVAAGNGDDQGNARDACTGSPARAPEAITVSATDQQDHRADWADFGRCVALFAPGVKVKSDWADSPSSTRTLSGTSMAAPAVTGALALLLQAHPGEAPDAARRDLLAAATTGVVQDGQTDPALMLRVRW